MMRNEKKTRSLEPGTFDWDKEPMPIDNIRDVKDCETKIGKMD